MDMYQKRKMRKEKKNNPNQYGSEKIQLNWEITTYGKLPGKAYK